MDDPSAPPRALGRDDAGVLADAVDRRAAELGTVRARLAAADTARHRAEHERDRLAAELERIRSRQPTRLAESIRSSLRPAVRAARRARSGPPAEARRRASDPVDEGMVGSAAPARPGLENEDPRQYRETLIRRVTGRDAGLAVMTIGRAIAGPANAGGPASGDGPAALPGWTVHEVTDAAVDAVVAGGIDVAVIHDPAFDLRNLPRHVITVAVAGGAVAPWLDQPWFDGYDIVIVTDEAAQEAVRAGSAKTGVVAGAGTDGRPSWAAVRDALTAWLSRPRIAILVQAPGWSAAATSGDYHVARALQRQFERSGHPTSVYLRSQWPLAATAREDAVLHLWGRHPFTRRPGQRAAIWVLYHPELLTEEVCVAYDHLFVASDALVADLAGRFGVTAESLHQATDPERFRPRPGGPHHELLFVGNSRGVRRTILDDVLPSPHELAVYGGGWTDDLLEPGVVRGDGIANADLAAAYGAADIVLNDHWVESAAAGIINNRLYDALAAGAFVISDPVAGMDAEFDGGVVTYRGAADLALTIERYLADPGLRRATAERGRAAVLARHTFEQRARRLLAALVPDGGSGSAG